MTRTTRLRERTVLVVDWDFWFRNPLEAGDRRDGERDVLLLYDWGHREAPFFIEHIWAIRAAAFMRRDLPLPQMEGGWQVFAQRFRFAKRCELTYADSNSYAGLLPRCSDVWLYDAHHDCYKIGPSLSAWAAAHTKDGSVTFSCEDWMAIHALQGARLHHRFPAWRVDARTGVCLDYDARMVATMHLDGKVADAAHDPETVIDHVFVCRSGAWVPPWCDGDFHQFLNTFAMPARQLDDLPMRRHFDLEQAKADAVAMRENTPHTFLSVGQREAMDARVEKEQRR